MQESDDPAKRRLKLLDDSRFPLVRYRVPEVVDHLRAEADPLIEDFNLLLDAKRSFVLITSGLHDREPIEVRKGRAVWFKANQNRLVDRCKALIHVEPDPDQRHRMLDQTQNLGDALGMPFFMVADEAEALACAGTALEAQDECPD